MLTALVPAMWAYNGISRSGDLSRRVLSSRKYSNCNYPGTAHCRWIVFIGECGYFHTRYSRRIFRFAARRVGCGRSFADRAGAAWLTVAMACSALGALHVVVMTGARIPYAMGAGWSFLSVRNTHSTVVSYSQRLADFSGGVAALLALTGTFEELYPLVRVCGVDFFRVDGDCGDLVAPDRARASTALSRLGLSLDSAHLFSLGIALTVNLWMVRPVRSTLGLLVIAGGSSVLLSAGGSCERASDNSRSESFRLFSSNSKSSLPSDVLDSLSRGRADG